MLGCRYVGDDFIDFFDNLVLDTIEKFSLFDKNSRIAVACSGGKDSMVLLYVLKKFGFDVSAIAVDEGIEGYRNLTLEFLSKFCKSNDINLFTKSFKDFSGVTMDDFIKLSDTSPCRVCGVWRRYLMGKCSSDFDVVSTGHNLDDEAQSIIMNVVKSNFDIIGRNGVISKKLSKGSFPIKVKPLYFCFEKEVASYAFLNGLMTKFNECPNFDGSFRNFIMTSLNDLEAEAKGFKESLVSCFQKYNFESKEENYGECGICGEVSLQTICKSCSFIEQFSKKAK